MNGWYTMDEVIYLSLCGMGNTETIDDRSDYLLLPSAEELKKIYILLRLRRGKKI
jgi:hypothetical protein